MKHKSNVSKNPHREKKARVEPKLVANSIKQMHSDVLYSSEDDSESIFGFHIEDYEDFDNDTSDKIPKHYSKMNFYENKDVQHTLLPPLPSDYQPGPKQPPTNLSTYTERENHMKFMKPLLDHMLCHNCKKLREKNISFSDSQYIYHPDLHTLINYWMIYFAFGHVVYINRKFAWHEYSHCDNSTGNKFIKDIMCLKK